MYVINNNFVMKVCLLFGVFLIFTQTSAACRNGVVLRSGVSQEEKLQIIDTHNRLRGLVASGQVRGQPGAQNMMEMYWDDEIAARAQQWANECVFAHDTNRYISRFPLGQNLGIIWSTATLDGSDDFAARIQSWFDEVDIYQWGSAFSAKTGHYTQMVWSNTYLVGCGFVYYRDNSKFNKLYVCNYGPAGNVIGSTPYKTGQPSCNNYGLSLSSYYSGLCNYEQQTKQYDYNPQTNIIQTTNYNTKPNYNINNDYITKPTYIDKNSQVELYTVNIPNIKDYSYQTIYNQLKKSTNYLDQQPQTQLINYPKLQPNILTQTKPPQVQTIIFPITTQSTTTVNSVTAKPLDKNSPFLTYRWNTLFSNLYRYNSIRK